MAAPFNPTTVPASISGSTNPDIHYYGGELFCMLDFLEQRMEDDTPGSYAAQAAALVALGVPVTEATILAVDKVETLRDGIEIVRALNVAWS